MGVVGVSAGPASNDEAGDIGFAACDVARKVEVLHRKLEKLCSGREGSPMQGTGLVVEQRGTTRCSRGQVCMGVVPSAGAEVGGDRPQARRRVADGGARMSMKPM